MIILFTDFGLDDIYVGQLKAVLAQQAPDQTVIDLLHSAPAFDIASSAHLLAALYPKFPPGSVMLGIVDPGVGGPRQPLVMVADGYWFVGPNNGLFGVIAARANSAQYWRIDWQPKYLSTSFHGRDLFAPIAAQIATGNFPAHQLTAIESVQGMKAAALAQIIFIDHFGNALTGLRAADVDKKNLLKIGLHKVAYAETFSAVPPGQAFWYENSLGLIEIAVHAGHAANLLEIKVGMAILPSEKGT